ncbi:MAG: DUF3341 domain-containing protein [Planctomycetota bacterium]|nr:DUF3341 domain-containing protein [Planctomycetota bacterium]
MTDSGRQLAGIIGLYDDPDSLIAAAEKVRDAGYEKWDCHTPYPVHGLDAAMGLKPSPLAFLCLGAGGVGAGAAMLMQWWMSAVDYPVRIGGKPFFSWPAFVPIAFELFVLFASLATMGGMLVLCKLGTWASPLHDSGVMAEVTTTRHGVVLNADDPKFDEESARALLEEAGCDDIRLLYENVEEEA